MGMEEKGTGVGRRELIGEAFPRQNRILSQEGNAVLTVGQADAVPVDRGVRVELVEQRRPQRLPFLQAQDRSRKIVGVGDDRRRTGECGQDLRRTPTGDQFHLDRIRYGGNPGPHRGKAQCGPRQCGAAGHQQRTPCQLHRD
jgi:hypothetical protein